MGQCSGCPSRNICRTGRFPCNSLHSAPPQQPACTCLQGASHALNPAHPAAQRLLWLLRLFSTRKKKKKTWSVWMCLFLLTWLFYSNKEQIVSFLLQAVWAGWGHASENPKLPELLHKNGIAFMGEEMELLIWCLVFVWRWGGLGDRKSWVQERAMRGGLQCKMDDLFFTVILLWKKGKVFQNSL